MLFKSKASKETDEKYKVKPLSELPVKII